MVSRKIPFSIYNNSVSHPTANCHSHKEINCPSLINHLYNKVFIKYLSGTLLNLGKKDESYSSCPQGVQSLGEEKEN